MKKTISLLEKFEVDELDKYLKALNQMEDRFQSRDQVDDFAEQLSAKHPVLFAKIQKFEQQLSEDLENPTLKDVPIAERLKNEFHPERFTGEHLIILEKLTDIIQPPGSGKKLNSPPRLKKLSSAIEEIRTEALMIGVSRSIEDHKETAKQTVDNLLVDCKNFKENIEGILHAELDKLSTSSASPVTPYHRKARINTGGNVDSPYHLDRLLDDVTNQKDNKRFTSDMRMAVTSYQQAIKLIAILEGGSSDYNKLREFRNQYQSSDTKEALKSSLRIFGGKTPIELERERFKKGMLTLAPAMAAVLDEGSPKIRRGSPV